MKNKTSIKTLELLEEFREKYEKLLAEYHQVYVSVDNEGSLNASIDNESIYLPSCAPDRYIKRFCLLAAELDLKASDDIRILKYIADIGNTETNN